MSAAGGLQVSLLCCQWKGDISGKVTEPQGGRGCGGSRGTLVRKGVWVCAWQTYKLCVRSDW